MFPGNPYLIVGLLGDFRLDPAYVDRETAMPHWRSSEAAVAGASIFFELADQRSAELGVLENGWQDMPASVLPGGQQWQLHEGSGNWKDRGPLRLRGWMQLGLYGPESTSEFTARFPHSPPTATALELMWDVLRTAGRPALGGVDAEVPLWLVGDDFTAKVEDGRPDPGIQHVPVLLEIGLHDPGNPAVRAAIASTVVSFCSGAELLPGVRTRRAMDAEPDVFLCDPADVSGVVALRTTVPSWSIETAAWLVDVATVACHDAGERGGASVSVRR